LNTSLKRVIIFLCLVMPITFIFEFFMMANGGLSNPNATVFLCTVMMIPAFSVLLTQFFTREGFKSPYLKLNFRDNVGKYFLSYFLVQLLIIAGTVIYFFIFPSNFDAKLESLSNLIYEQTQKQPTLSSLYSMMAVQISFSFISGPIVNILFAFGEEYGWRGYLFPHLAKVTTPLKASLITGIIWGIWHAPIIAMGHNYGLNYPGYPYLGIFAMIVFCVVVGIVFSYFTHKTESVFHSVLMHSAINAFASAGVFFDRQLTPNPFIGPAPTGIIGGSAFIISGIICAVLLRKESKK